MNMMRANKHYFSCHLVSTPAQLFNCVVILLISIIGLALDCTSTVPHPFG
jgi:hypothetical protein